MTSTSPQLVQEVERMVRLNRRVTINELADSVDVSFGSMQAILTSTLGMRRIAAMFVPRLLTNDQKEQRVEFCEDLLQRIQEDPPFTSRLIIGDQTWVYGYDPEWKCLRNGNVHRHQDRRRSRAQRRTCFSFSSIFMALSIVNSCLRVKLSILTTTALFSGD